MTKGADMAIKRNPTPAERAAAVKASFEQKVAIVESWARDGVPEGATPPQNRSQLRRWTGPEGNLRAWTDPTIDAERSGKYPSLTDRFLRAVDGIRRRQGARGNQVKEMEAEIALLKSQKSALEIQNAGLIGEIDRLQRRIRLLTDLIEAQGGTAPP